MYQDMLGEGAFKKVKAMQYGLCGARIRVRHDDLQIHLQRAAHFRGGMLCIRASSKQMIGARF
jgi:hypothetical protein